MRKMLWSLLKLPLAKEGRHGKEEETDSLMSKSSNVNEEYKEAFRTKSYIEICNKVQHHLVRTACLDEERCAASSSPPPPPPPPPSSLSLSLSPSPAPTMQISHLSEYLLEPPHQELISDSSNFHHQFLVNYFEISLDASRILETLLTNIHQVRNNHRKLKKVIKMIKRLPNTNDDYNHVLYKNLASFASRRNPFSRMTSVEFHDLHEIHVHLLQELTSKCRKTKKRSKIIKLIKRVMSSFLVMGCGALVIVVLVLAMHCMVGLAAAPALVIWSLMGKKMARVRRRCDEGWLERVVAMLDIAARGVYIMINDFDTMRQMVKRLQDEIERRKYLAEICVRKGKNIERLKEVVREFQMHESCFLEQLDELEKLIYLCFLDINRSRRLLAGEMVRSS